jgi:hypothetical protein
MRRRAKWIAGATAAAALAATLALAASPAGACACGVAIEATVSSESALVIEQPGREELVLSLDLTSDGSGRAAVVLPVPVVPEVAAIQRGDPLAYLEQATAPPPEAAGGDDAAAAPGVEVIGRETIGGYDVATLGAGEAEALGPWLADNGYTVPRAADPILAEYVDEGWRFVAIRLAPEAEGRLKPLVVSFDTDEVVYPMRLAQAGTEPVNLTLYTLADGPRSVDGLEAVWQGDVSELSPRPPPELDELIPESGYVTRLEALGADPAAFTADLVIEPAPGAPTGTAPPTAAAAAGDDDGGISAAALIAIIAAGVAFAIGLALLTGARRAT